MKISLNWLKSYSSDAANHIPSLEVLSKQLPMAGFEIDAAETVHEDIILDISITANRGDCLSVRGMSREIACLNHFSFSDWILETKTQAWQKADANDYVQIEAKEACTLYAGAWIHNIPLTAKTPESICDRLNKAGIEPILPIVDLCNYVMLEIGQPLHAFDANRISALQVRMAHAGETIEVLGGQKITLDSNTLVIADTQAVQAIAGIIGGLSAAVDNTTTSIFLESAHFRPDVIAGRARQYGLQTEAAQRFERGVDPLLPSLALNYAAQLIVQHLGGTLGIAHLAHGTPYPPPQLISLRGQRIQRMLGTNFAPHLVEQILPDLGMLIENTGDNHWQVTAPSFRFDIQKEVDLIEELARIDGYDKIPSHSPRLEHIVPAQNNVLQQSAHILVNRGYHEIISYSFISETLQQLCFPNSPKLQLQNPLSSELAVMRASLWPSLLVTLQYNLNRKQSRARYFETGLTYQSEWDETIGSVRQEPVLAGLAYGSLYPEQWGIKAADIDFFDVKADLLAILAALGCTTNIHFVACQTAMLQNGQSAEILLDGEVVGLLGRLHPQLQQEFQLTKPVYLFELKLAKLPIKPVAKYQEISRFPAVRRDFAFLLPRTQATDDILRFVKTELDTLCQEVVLFDVYQGKNIPVDQKSIAFSVTLQDMQTTLTDEAINTITAKLIDQLSQKFMMQLRE